MEKGRDLVKSKKEMSLHRAIFRILFVIVAGIFLLLGMLDIYLLSSYQETVRSGWLESLNRCAEELSDDLEDLSSDLYDVYYYDSNFQELSRARGIEALPTVYELEERLKTRMLLQKKPTGYVLYFDEDSSNRRYFFDAGAFANAEVEELKQLTEDLSRTAPVIREWYYLTVNGKVFAALIYKNNNVCLCEIYGLEKARRNLEEELSEAGAEVFYDYQGSVTDSPGDGETLEENLEYHDEIHDGVYYSRKQIKGTDLVLHLAVPIHIWTFLNAQQVFVLVIAVLVLAVAGGFYRRLSNELFVPLDHLTAEMRRIGSGDWESGIHTRSRFVEIQQVIGTTDRMIDEIEAQKLLTYEKTIQEQKARMQYLSLQLNPHFYLNGLKTLNYLAMKGENEKIQEIIIKLSEYMRYLLQREDEMVPLGQEVEFVGNYVQLREEMTDRKISVTWKIDPETLRGMVPRLCIQTFVENSFKYAKVGNAMDPLVLSISSNRFSAEGREYLEIMVRDNGNGYSDDLLAALNEPPAEGGISVGINNLKRRCGFLYVDDVQFGFYNDSGAVSDLFYPWVEGE